MLSALVVALTATGCVVRLTPTVMPPQSSAESTSSPTTPQTSPTGPAPSQLATAVVLVVQLDASGSPGCYGSGTLIDEVGTIVTNFHVVEVTDDCDYERIAIGMSASEKTAPDLRYVASVHAVDVDLDLAVLRITSAIDGGPVSGPLPFVELADSDEVHIGDELHVYGYPGIGGATITSTPGEVSGFTESADAPGSAWIKTSATMAGGNSGGLAADSHGHMVGIPTRAGAADADDIVDCRRADTNDDGFIDEADGCVPVGGFINSLRPVNLALPLIRRAATSLAIPIGDLSQPMPEVDAAPRLSGLVFATGVDPDLQPIGGAASFPSGTDRLCAVYDFEGTAAVESWESVWTRDKDVVHEAGIADTWSFGDSGTTWFCTGSRDEIPLADGLWELKLYQDSDPDSALTGSVYVGDGHDVVEVDVWNSLEQDVCVLNVAPTAATSWQGDLLGPDEILASGETRTLSLPAGDYDLRALACDGTELSRSSGTVAGGAELVLG